MSKTLVSTDHLSALVDECKEDMKTGNGTRLLSLANTLQSIAVVTDNHVFHSVPAAIGQFSTELQRSRNLVSLPILPEGARERQEKVLKDAVEAGMSSLDVVQAELCSDKDPDCRKVLEAVGSLMKHSTRMYLERRAVQPPFSAPGEED
jgi:hypothetical protein